MSQPNTSEIIPVTNSVNSSGTQQKPNGIIQTQTTQNEAYVICDSGTVYINGDVQFSPPQPIADASKIFSQDLSSQLQCINGGEITVLGEIQGYSTTAQTGQAISQATADFVTQDFLESNYFDVTETQNYVGNAISALDTVFMPIDETLDQISPPETALDLNQQKIVNLADPVDLQDAVNLQYLQENYTDTTQSQIFIGNAISDLSSVYYPQTDTLNDIAAPTASLSLNSQRIINLATPQNAQDAVTLNYLNNYPSNSQLTTILTGYITTGYATANLLLQSVAAATYQPISAMSNYITNSQLISALADYTLLTTFNDTVATLVTQTYLMTNYYTATYIAATFATISSLSSYVTNSSLAATLSGYVSNTSLANTLLGYYTSSQVDSLISGLSSVYLSISSFNSQIANYVTSSSLATTLSGYVTSAQLAAFNYLPISSIGSYTQRIRTNTSTGTRSEVDCQQSSEILFKIADVQKLRMYVPAGQATQPCGLIADDKIQMISGENSFSLTGQKALQAKPTQNFSGLYISGLDNAALNVGQQIQIGSQFCQKLALASGHTDIGGGTQVLYSTISNSAEGVAQQNLQISGGTPQTDNTLVLYSDSYATALGQNLTAQFTKKTGYSATTSITEANQFSSKAYVDSAISGLSTVYQTISGMSAYLTTSAAAVLYYTKTVTDSTFATISSLSNYVTNSSLATTLSSYLTTATAAATYVLQTTPLNDLAVPTGDLAMEGFEIKGLQLVPSIASSAASKSYVDSQIAGGGLTKAVADTYYYSFANTNLPTQSLNMNSQKIINLLTPTLATDASTKAYVDTRTPFRTSLVTVGTLNASTTPTAVTSVSGFVTSSTKAQTSYGGAGNIVIINYANAGYVPIFTITPQVNNIGTNLEQVARGACAFVTAVSATQATILLVIPSGNLPQLTTIIYALNILAMSNTLT